jgi:uncharacterized glyoxalase superfamily protein PhnB
LCVAVLGQRATDISRHFRESRSLIFSASESRQIIGAGTAYVICDEIDAYFASIKAAGATARSEPQDRIYGMRDFAVLDPDGNQLTFGCDLD